MASTLVDALLHIPSVSVVSSRSGARYLNHDEALARGDWSSVQLVLCDAMRSEDEQLRDRALPRFAGLELAGRLARVPSRPRYIGYTASRTTAPVNIALDSFELVEAVYDSQTLLENLLDAVTGHHVHQVQPPTAADRRRLGVGREAKLYEAILAARARPEEPDMPYGDVWHLVCTQPIAEGQRRLTGVPDDLKKYVQRRIVPLLDNPGATYLEALRVIQQVCRLPAPE
jgi:hypothetical protein